MFTQFADLVKAWQSSKLDAFIWVATFLSAIIVDIDVGLAVGVAVSLLTLLWRNQRAYACILGEIPRTGIYVDCHRFDAVRKTSI
jgi:MFS superfamily sulfate permease-like transporter